MAFKVIVGDGEPHEVTVTRLGALGAAHVVIDGSGYEASLTDDGITFDGHSEPIVTAVDGDDVWVHAFGRAWRVSVIDPRESSAAATAGEDLALAPMPGTVITVAVAPGEPVGEGQRLVVIESMKMQSEIVALREGVVDEVFVAVGDTFERGAPLVSLAESSAGAG